MKRLDVKRYKLLDHTADIGIIAFGKTLPEAFASAAYAMFDIITDAGRVREIEKFDLHISAVNTEELLVTWLDELLYRYETERVVYGKFVIESMDERNLHAVVSGEKVDLARHQIKAEIKNVTYHNLKVEKTDGGWKIQVIFDV